jgi:hypothetical protein
MEKFISCETLITYVYNSNERVKSYYDFTINNKSVPIEYRRDNIRSINKCIVKCRKTINNVIRRSNNVVLLYNFFVTSHNCDVHNAINSRTVL